MNNVFKILEDFILDGHISIRREILKVYLDSKGNLSKTLEFCEEQKALYKFEEEEYIRNEYSSVIKLLKEAQSFL